ncbi:FBP domain-containing protein [Galbitalea sp. SE-J8]|uniref:FBP domain-containing protein n=1 Tax=Galbitalea sp. SE-J8 TaxID=3054952 RepID=UPI00259CA205|nr:FBP domain-containing protein [Galbitalea sp. SE-J8]MDM4764200.1 FBP domain-containing protein [Galbitalea sp. SE-J8]
MKPLTEDEIRASFVNATEEDLERMPLPGLHETVWEDREYLGWRDPANPLRGYIVHWSEGADGERPVGILVRTVGPHRGRGSAMCSLCHTTQPLTQVSLFSAPKAGAAGRRGDTLGTYICEDLACSHIIRMAPPHLQASADLERRAAGLLGRVQSFTSDVLKTA